MAKGKRLNLKKRYKSPIPKASGPQRIVEQVPVNYFGDRGGGNYAEFEPDGTLVFHGDARVWRVASYEIHASKIDSPAGHVEFDYTNIGVEFDGSSSASDIVCMLSQAPKDWAQGTVIYPHIHWAQVESNIPAMKVDIRVYNRGNLIPASFTTLTLDSHKFTYDSGTLSQVSFFGPVDTTGITTCGFMEIKLYRVASEDSYTNGVLIKSFDICYQADTLGNREMAEK